MMRVGMSAMPLERGQSGIGVYIRKMVFYLSRRTDLHLIVFGFEEERKLLDLGPGGEFVPIHSRWASVPTNLVWHLSVLPLLALRHRLDRLFLPAGNRRMTLLPPRGAGRVMATVHDLAPFHMPNKYDRFRTAYVTRVLPLLWRRTPQLIAVSQATAADMVLTTGVDPARVTVVWNGVEADGFFPMDKQQARRRLKGSLPFGDPFILYVARLEHPGKNHVGLLRAYAALLAESPELAQRLVFCGGEWSGCEAIYAEVERLKISDRVHFTGFVDENLLQYFYNSADLFVFPSRFEGFGIPAIEAMSCGLPVVAANRSSLPEIVGKAGILFDPDDTNSMLTALKTGLFDQAFRDASVAEGKRRAALFSWEAAAEKVARSALTGEVRKHGGIVSA